MAITFTIENDIAWITFDDGKANAINPEFIDGFSSALDEVEAEAKAIILCGREGIFSGGFDLNYFKSATLDETNKLIFNGAALTQRLFRCPRAVIAACTGHALAMGAMLLLGCDTRIGMAGNFKIGLNETSIGRPIPRCHMVLPNVRLDPRRKTEAVLHASLFAPDAACNVGFLDLIVEQDALMDKAAEIAQQLAALPGDAYATNKSVLRGAAFEAYDQALAEDMRELEE